MLNTDEFIVRLETLMDTHQLSASAFADKVGVQRSSLSHLLSGRNNPSLDFIIKVTEAFPDTDLYWLLKGVVKDISANPAADRKEVPAPTVKEDAPDLFSSAADENQVVDVPQKDITENEVIEKVMIFYANGTFSSYKPK